MNPEQGNDIAEHAEPTATSTSDARKPSAPLTVQRAVKVGVGEDAQEIKPESADSYWRAIADLATFKQRDEENRQVMQNQFKKWVEVEPGDTTSGRSNPRWGRKRQERWYDTVQDLELGLYGWASAKSGRRDEKVYARTVVASDVVELRLNKVLRNILYRVHRMDLEPDVWGQISPSEKVNKILEELDEDYVEVAPGRRPVPRSAYATYANIMAEMRGRPELYTAVKNGPLDVMMSPERYSFRDKIIALHGLKEYFIQQRAHAPVNEGAGTLPQLSEDLYQVTIEERAETLENGEVRRTRITSSESGGNPGDRHRQATVDEHSDVVKFARRHHLPMWAAMSRTTANALNLARWADASIGDLTAVAHSFFAFWRLNYDHSTGLAPHTMHEALDIARNFGVPYDPFDRGAEITKYDSAEDRARQMSMIRDELREDAETFFSLFDGGDLDAAIDYDATGLDQSIMLSRMKIGRFKRNFDELLASYDTAPDGDRARVLNEMMDVLTSLRSSRRHLARQYRLRDEMSTAEKTAR
ncbi:hypothetical protein [Pseudonocardia yunnanensis]|uniref:Uncharacterized protein n=1 Tax=Pseudonocardia yunnanensis TaxID=58107 RepID=A0ABW4FAL4_9PSEU